MILSVLLSEEAALIAKMLAAIVYIDYIAWITVRTFMHLKHKDELKKIASGQFNKISDKIFHTSTLWTR